MPYCCLFGVSDPAVLAGLTVSLRLRSLAVILWRIGLAAPGGLKLWQAGLFAAAILAVAVSFPTVVVLTAGFFKEAKALLTLQLILLPSTPHAAYPSGGALQPRAPR